MTSALPDMELDASMEERCRRLGEILGLAQPVSEAVLLAALEHETYARNLLTCRRAPGLLNHLLEHPPAAPRPSAMVLAQRAAGALVRWAATGFSTVDDETYARRMAACTACPNLALPPEQALYKLVGPKERVRICTKCGCVVAHKARLTSEACPDPHPDRPELTRWSESREPPSHRQRS
jgi:hypothetical protein